MIRYPNTQAEYDQYFTDERSCLEYIISACWPDGPRCQICQHDKLWRINGGKVLECSACGHKMRPLAGTIFQDTHLPLKLWMDLAWHLMSQKYGANATGLARTLDISYPTAWNILSKLRRAMIRDGREKLGPAVEVDEAFIGGLEEGVPGRGAKKKALVAVAVELDLDLKTMSRARFAVIPNAKAATLIPFVERIAEPGSTIVTDGWSAYHPLEGAGFKHVVRLKKNEDDLLTHVHLVISLVKRWFLRAYQGAIQPANLGYYLDEYSFRFNRRKSSSRGKLFGRLIEQCVATPPVTRGQLLIRSRDASKVVDLYEDDGIVSVHSDGTSE